MKTSRARRLRAGYISLLLVLSTGTILTILMVYAYKRAVSAQDYQGQVQLRIDYSEKEETILRSIVAIAPNRAIQTMQVGSNASPASRTALSWQTIFTDAIGMANARTSISPAMAATLGVTNHKLANAGDATLGDATTIFKAIPNDTGLISVGINRSLGTGYPVPLTCSDSTMSSRDLTYPIISNSKIYGNLASSGVNASVTTYPNQNQVRYPQINFGYAKPGDWFVAKRNWWAFSMDVAASDAAKTYLARNRRNFVLSIYEIPSQLAISASSFMALGQYASGDSWQNVNISGPVFGGKVNVEGNTPLSGLSSRRGMNLSSGSTVNGQSFTGNPFAPGVRENYQVTTGNFFPVSLASESGRAAFVPINRGKDFFDRFSHDTENNVLSNTTWNNYSVGALQAAMRLDIAGVTSSSNATPTMLNFSYIQTNGNRVSSPMKIPLNSAVLTTLPAGFVAIAAENASYTFTDTVDVAYGESGGFTFRNGVTGKITFDNATFGDPLVGTVKKGYWRPRSPFDIRTLANGQICVGLYPERIPSFLTRINAGNTALNHSIVINVDYSGSGLNNISKKPNIPCTATDYGLVMRECGNLTGFTKGFSLVSNLRLYIGDDFNITPTTAPSGYTPPTGTFYPPCSLFAPEKRYGVDVDPFAVTLSGQVGSLASETVANPVRPLDSKTLSGATLSANRITVNLRPISHPAELPPITMMNWLVLLEERRKEYY